MRKLVKGVLLVGACLVLTGCPEVRRLSGHASGVYYDGFLPKQGNLQRDFRLVSGSQVDLSAGSTITIGDGSDSCTFTGPLVFQVGASCDQDDDDDHRRKDDKDRKSEDQESGDQSQQQTEQQGQDQQGQDQQAQNQQQGQPGRTETRPLDEPSAELQPEGGSVNTSDQPVPDTGVGQPSALSSTYVKPVLQALGGLVVAKKIRDEIKEDDQPISR